MLKFKMVSGFFLAWVIGLSAADFTLIRQGRPAAVIVKPADSKAADNAVADFNDGVKRCSGNPLPVSAGADAGKNRIVIELVKLPLPESDRFTIAFPDARTMKITATELSLRWAFNHILEEHFGCRFLFQVSRDLPYDESINHYPAGREVAVPMRKVVKTASFNLGRTVDWRTRKWDWRWNIKAVLINSHLMTADVFPVYKYAADQSWPKEILPVLNKKKFMPPKAKTPLHPNPYIATRNYSAHWNPCFSHPKSVEIAIANILEILDKDPKRVNICLSVNDGGGMCQCAACLKAVGKKVNSIGHRDYSPVYWKWVNTIADRVNRKYPNVYFTALAYREVIEPPAFKLNPHVVPELCFELVAMNNREAAVPRLDLLRRWKAKAAQLDLWDYSFGLTNFLFPRIYFKSHSRHLKTFYEYNGRMAFIECNSKYPGEGPKYYLMAKMMMDINADPEKIVMDWCTAAVGGKAAPYLRKYYQFWEDYWTGDEIRKTSWYSKRVGTYYQLHELPTHALALKKGDMKKLRALMEKVVALAETPEQKKRAGILMQWFERSELAAQVLFSELVRPDCTLGGPGDALELLRQVPAAVKAHDRLMKHPLIKYYPRQKNISAAQLAVIGLVQPYMSDPKVKAAASKLAENEDIPLILRSLLKIWLGMKPANMVKNGSFEEAAPLPRVLWKEGGAYRSSKIASDGKYSFRLPPRCTYAYRIPAQTGKLYLFMFDCYLNKTSIEGLLNFQLSPYRGKRPVNHHHYLKRPLAPGKWTTFTGICCAERGADSIELMIWLRKFEDDDDIYMDNVRVYSLEDLK